MKNLDNKAFNKNENNIPNSNSECLVSKASRDIMLNRIGNGEEIEFPFTSIKSIKNWVIPIIIIIDVIKIKKLNHDYISLQFLK